MNQMSAVAEVTKSQPFDPFQKAWDTYESDTNGLAALAQREVCFGVLSGHGNRPLARLIGRAIAGQEAQYPETRGLLSAADIGYLAIADAKPITDPTQGGVHIDTVSRRPLGFHEVTQMERELLNAVTDALGARISAKLNPSSGDAEFRFGQQVRTAHKQVIARNQAADGTDWTVDRPFVGVEVRQKMYDTLNWSPSDASLLDRAFIDVLARYARFRPSKAQQFRSWISRIANAPNKPSHGLAPKSAV